MYKQFNLNETILVKLNEEGIKHYLEKYNEWLPQQIKLKKEDFIERADESGFYSFQAWQFIQIFGSTIYMDCPLLFDTTIKINELSLK